MANTIEVNGYSFEPNQWNKKSSQELRTIIKALTQEANERIKMYQEEGEELKPVENEIETLYNIGSRLKKTGALGTGRIQNRNHEGLVYQARALYNFHKWDFVSLEGKKTITEREERRANTLRERFEAFNNLSDEDITNITEVMGAVGKKTLEKYGSAQVVAEETIKEAVHKKINVVDIMKKLAEESKGFTQEELIDKLLIRLQEELEKL